MKVKCYIQGIAAITPQHTFEGDIFAQPLESCSSNLLSVREPDYKAYIPANSLRRMSRMLKMGLTTAIKCLQDSGLGAPGAIVTGTGKGSLQDTERFLKDIRQYNERALNPTPFIQSTYNAVNGMIAVQQQCTTYNNTFVHRGFSFEHALLDSMLLLQEGTPHTLTGAFDEMTEEHCYIKSRIGMWKTEKVNSAQLYEHPSPGTIAGEGAVFFALSARATAQSYARIAGLQLFYKPQPGFLAAALPAFLQQQGLSPRDIDLVLTGRNADSNYAHFYQQLEAPLPGACQLPFKHLCGEYETAGAFATWLAAHILKAQQAPRQWFPMVPAFPERVERILLYNHFFGEQHVLMLLERAGAHGG
ncbi:beta-ketoacyl synthase chain length factor [Chitinophaga japonensis]|uniref:Beta-ketoacyl synthase-like protein n=1 Tax=Chitinophaga japonensis TaxID=104662 RepID=A0A562SIQ9_CHIJA|nr:beta-ketoacyl synthase chain length factor [Chitinophaga japonensis]TWI80874.1 beta-ketoacyl synthase-like protein [Chitinophaga japonensis]